MGKEKDSKAFEPITESEWNGRYTFMGNRSRETVNELLRKRLENERVESIRRED